MNWTSWRSVRVAAAAVSALALAGTGVPAAAQAADLGASSVEISETASLSMAARKATGSISGRINNRLDLSNATDGLDHWAPYYRGQSDCSSGAGNVAVRKLGSSFVRKACVDEDSGRFRVMALPAGKYTVSVWLSTPGYGKPRYWTKGGKKLVVAVRARKNVSLGSRRQAERRATVQGIFTTPTVPEPACWPALVDKAGRDRTAGYALSTLRTTRAKTTYSYFLWSKSNKRGSYTVKFSCQNFAEVDQDAPEWGPWSNDPVPARFDPSNLNSKVTTYLGPAGKRANASYVTLKPGMTPTANMALKWLPAWTGKARLVGTGKVGTRLTVKLTGLSPSARIAVRWNGGGADSLNDATPRFYSDPDWDSDDGYPKLYDKLSYKVQPGDVGAAIFAEVLVWRNCHWTLVKDTNKIKARR